MKKIRIPSYEQKKANVVRTLCLLKTSAAEEYLFTKMEFENKGFWLVEKSVRVSIVWCKMRLNVISI